MNDNVKHKLTQYLNSEFSNLEQYEFVEYPNEIYFIKNGNIMFELDNNFGVLSISYDHLWIVLQEFIGLTYHQTKEILIDWVKSNYVNLNIKDCHCVEISKQWNDVLKYCLKPTLV